MALSLAGGVLAGGNTLTGVCALLPSGLTYLVVELKYDYPAMW